MRNVPTKYDPPPRKGRVVSWASIIEEKTMEQAALASTMPFIHSHLALMPDAHVGKGATVGSVIPTLGAIMPAAVGVDIGCGMIAVRTQYLKEDLPAREHYAALRVAIENAVPLSAGNYNEDIWGDCTQERIEHLESKALQLRVDPAAFVGNWRMQLGSLGSGNHFIEVCLDEQDRVWLFLHSGSRGVGNQIATNFIKIAKSNMRKNFIDLPDPDLAYLVEGTDAFWAYIRHLNWAQEFAFENRAEMMDRVVYAFRSWINIGAEAANAHVRLGNLAPVIREQEINCHHNYTEKERHYGKEVWLSRKGAINAEKDVWGLIPGSMGTASYVVQGLGNPSSFNSSPHGAGRVYGRRHAERTFTFEELQKSMGDIEWRQTEAFLDEIPAAYKNIDQIMIDAESLVVARHTLRQIINVKGD